MSIITLTKLEKDDIEKFVKDNQEAFKYGAMEELYPETIVWETCTPYFEVRNIHL